MTFHHIGVAVRSIDTTAAIYEAGGYRRSVTTYDPAQNVDVCWLTRDGMPTIELLAPVDKTSPICNILDKNGVTPYHTCYVVENIESAVTELRRMKYVVISKPEKAKAINDSLVCFLYNRNVGLIELVEAPGFISV